MMYKAIRLIAIAAMIVLAVVTIKRERKREHITPLTLVTMVTETIVMTAHAENVRRVESPPVVEKPPGIIKRLEERLKEKIVIPRRDPPSRTQATDGSGAKWTFPYSCSKVKWYAERFSQETLEKMRVMAGERAPTNDERQQIGDCIQGRFK